MRPTLLNSLFSPVSALDGIGPKLEKAITRLLRGNEQDEPARIGELLFHTPHQIIDRRNRPGITNAVEGAIVTLQVHVDRHQPAPRGNKRIPYRVFVHDDTGEMALVFFHAHVQWVERALPVGEKRYVSGRMEWFNDRASMVHPDHIVTEEEFAQMPLVEPVYPSTAGLSQRVLAKAVRAALALLPDLPEWADGALVAKQKWPDFGTALERLHHPRDMADLVPASPAMRRLAHDELLAGQMALALMRARMRKSKGKPHLATGEKWQAVLQAFGHAMTASQASAVDDIRADMAKPERMLRLLQGDVGSGKTLVALAAISNAVEAGNQAAIMAPTEILARQHQETLAPLCSAAGITIEILTGREKGAKRSAILEGLSNGTIDVLIGTHALFQSGVEFADLGLAVIDEQHRFGVHQRLALGEKGGTTDMLVMTATPIPRTLVLTFFGDMDVSRLTEKPAGRQPITTSAVPLERLDELVQRIGGAIERGEKVYWLCPLVEESEELPVTSATDRHADLARRFGDRTGLVHGRMSSAEKDAAMAAFRKGDTRLLVATTVIEVGVDVPDATIIVIEHAERFGLAQLHQLRGRVGRGDKPSSCILLYKAPLGETALARLSILRETEDGFRIAEEDLRLRGEGEVLGTRQSGMPGFRFVEPQAHGDLLEISRDEARLAVEQDPQLDGETGEALRILLYLFGQDAAVRLLKAG